MHGPAAGRLSCHLQARARPPSGSRGRSSCSPVQRQICPEIASRISVVGQRLRVRRSGAAIQQRPRGQHHARRAEPALQAVHRPESPPAPDRARRRPRGPRPSGSGARRGCGQHRAGLDRLAVHQHHAGPAVGRVAAPVRAGQPQLVAQEVHEQQSAARASAVVSASLTVTRPASAPALGRARGGSRECAGDEHAGDMAFVLRRAALIGDRRQAAAAAIVRPARTAVGRRRRAEQRRLRRGGSVTSAPTAASAIPASATNRRYPA